MPQSKVAAIVLAAGGSTRFEPSPTPKQLLTWQGRPLVAHTADIAWAAGLDPVIVVLGAEADRVAPALEGRPVQVLRNYRWEAGMSSSISVGLAALPAHTEAALFIPIDQPLITPHVLQELIARWEDDPSADIVVPRTEKGQRGTPVLFGRDFFPELAQLSGDVGGRALFETYANRMAYVDVSPPEILTDADTPETFERLQARADPADRLGAVRAVICDMDGVLWRGHTPMPGLEAFFELLAAHDLPHVLVTNNASRTPKQYVAKLAEMGIETTTDHVLNSSMATAAYLAEHAPSDAVIYPIGGPGIFDALQDQSFRLSAGDRADYVVVSWDRDLSWHKLATATRLIREGAAFIGTNPDVTFPMDTTLAPGAGAQLVLLEASTDVAPTVVGKPEPILYRQAMARMEARAEETLVIGDRLNTDILGGLRLGMTTALLLSGVTTREELARSPIHPDLVFEDLAELVAAW